MMLQKNHSLQQSEGVLEEICSGLGLDCQLELEVDGKESLRIEGSAGSYCIRAPKEHMIYRGLLVLASQLAQGKTDIQIQERPAYRQLGFMEDCSRNAVLTVEASKILIRQLALMGYSHFQLYMEDTYQLREEPYFGYFRGAYTREELQAIEEECHRYGMEFIPCIQTLAHLIAYLKWNISSIQAIRDVDNILLIGDERTYALIDKMFEALSHLKTRTINIGMDEAHLVGLGQYLNQHGYQKRSLIMCQHLERVLDIADKYGFHCSMWSDMFFQLLTASKDYTGQLEIDSEIQAYLDRLKDRVTLIYWDYYQTSRESYAQKLASHQQLGEQIAFASGAWKWIGFTPDNDFSMRIAPEAHAACQEYGVQEVTVTAWGDNGGECATFSILPSLHAWAELQYRGNLDCLAEHFYQLHQVSLDDFLQLDLPNKTPSHPGPGHHGFNPSRYILYQDILCPLLQEHIDAEKDSAFYQELAPRLAEIGSRSKGYAYLFDTQAKLCQVLATKAVISADIRQAYQEGNRQVLAEQVDGLQQLRTDLESFYQALSYQWMVEKKVFGLDTVDIRLGGLDARIRRAIQRLQSYLNNEVPKLDELEVPILPYDDFHQDKGFRATTANQWQIIATASTIYTT
ncbi:beta-N-acetylhexosaminidase [Streptococcus suis]|uniref:beta-N-acetylhexosaminidase n=5 Tax=Streptococcus suis TaxID=1307 RepID=UPI000CF59165